MLKNEALTHKQCNDMYNASSYVLTILITIVVFYRCDVWVQNTRREDLLEMTTKQLYNYRICADHFEDGVFMNVAQKNSLMPHAIPTLFDVPNPPPKVTIKRKLPTRHPSAEPTPKKAKATTSSAEGAAPPVPPPPAVQR